jgi:predicted site-specific integrase-resolvase
MKLSQYAKELGITYRTAWNHYHAGLIPNAYELPSGAIIVPNDTIKSQECKENNIKKVCIYGRVSSSQNKDNLDNQVKRLEQYCVAKGWQIVRIVKEVGSGLNDYRPQLANIISKINEYDHVVVEHKDRLTRTGFNYFELFAPNKFHVVNMTNNDTENLLEDLVSIITSYCARLYGKRRGKRKTEKIIKELQENDS